jgi:predicted RNA-binding protein with PUA-like domain
VVKPAYPDPTDEAGKAVTVDVKPVGPVKNSVTLAAIKADPKLAEFGLVRQSRLSVVPVSAEQWKMIEKMAK